MKKAIKRKQRRTTFTLVELLVAMAVFSILLLLMLQFFTGAQQLWVSTQQKNDLYADARVAMDLMSTLLQNTYYSSGEEVPFIIENNATNNSCIYFPTQTEMEFPGESSTRYICFKRGSTTTNNHLLGMAIFSDKDNSGNRAFSFFFPPYDSGAITSIGAARTQLKNVLDAKFDFPTAQADIDAGKYNEDTDYAILLDTVTGLRFVPLEYDSSSTTITGLTAETASTYEKIPYVIEIQLTMMDKKNFDIWDKDYNGRSSSLSGDAKERADRFRLQHEHTFTRAVYIGDR